VIRDFSDNFKAEILHVKKELSQKAEKHLVLEN